MHCEFHALFSSYALDSKKKIIIVGEHVDLSGIHCAHLHQSNYLLLNRLLSCSHIVMNCAFTNFTFKMQNMIIISI